MPFFRYIDYEDIVYVPIVSCLCVMSVIVYIPDTSVLSYDTVFHIIHVIIFFICYLAFDGRKDSFPVIGMDHARKCIPGKLPEFLLRLAPENPASSFIYIDYILVFIRMIYEKTSRHLLGNPWHGIRLMMFNITFFHYSEYLLSISIRLFLTQIT